MADLAPEFVALQRAVAGRYSLEREIGRGGMGIVFLARDVALSRPVAIKLLPAHFAADRDMRERFLREARTAAGLFHPNIVPIHLVEESGDLVYFVMAYVNGESVGERVRRAGPMTPFAVRKMMQEVAWALSYAHEKGVVHRDIKPDNILLERPRGRALVADFGIAHLTQVATETEIGEVFGTVQYMSPEQATGGAIDGRSDLYSLGIVGFYALSGMPPFKADSAAAYIHKHVTTPAPRVATVARRAPHALAEAIDQCLAKDPAARFPSGEALAKAIDESGQAVQEMPPEVRALVRRVREVGTAAATVGAFATLTPLLVPWLVTSLKSILAPLLGIWGVGMIVGLAPGWFGLISLARRAVRAGYDITFVRSALADEAQTLIEEGAAQLPQRPRSKSAVRRPKKSFVFDQNDGHVSNPVIRDGLGRERTIHNAYRMVGLNAFILAVILFINWGNWRGMLLSLPLLLIPLGFLGFSGVVGIGAGPAVGEDSPIVALGWGERLLYGRFGEFLLRQAGRREIAAGVRAKPVAERTELALGGAVNSLLKSLPPDVRERLRGVPDALRGLQGTAQKLREREAWLAEALVWVDDGAPKRLFDAHNTERSQLESARSHARERLATTVEAIEAMRLNLLKLQSGIGSPDDLTADLQRAHEVSRAVDAELAARKEVDELLKRE
jgi:serine/threonine-protein kinase